MYLAVMVGKLKQVVREWCRSTKGPPVPTMTDSLLAPGREVLYMRYHLFCPCQEQEGPQARGACSIFRMKRDRNKGFYSEKVLIGGLHCIVLLNRLGNLCLGMCCYRFTILSRALNGVSNEHSCSDCIF